MSLLGIQLRMPVVRRELDLPLRTQRLTIRAFEPGDRRAIYRACRERRVSRGIPMMPFPYHLRDADAFIHRAHRTVLERRAFPLAVTELRCGRLVGAVEVGEVDWTNGHAELGYWIEPGSWGQGFATEAGRRMIEFAFTELGLHRLHAGVLPFNTPSARVLRRLGFRREGVLRDFYRIDGTWHSVIRVALLSNPARAGPQQ